MKLLGEIGGIQREAGPETHRAIMRLEQAVMGLSGNQARLIQNNQITIWEQNEGDLILLDDQYLYWRRTLQTPVASRSAGIRYNVNFADPDRFEFDTRGTIRMILNDQGRLALNDTPTAAYPTFTVKALAAARGALFYTAAGTVNTADVMQITQTNRVDGSGDTGSALFITASGDLSGDLSSKKAAVFVDRNWSGGSINYTDNPLFLALAQDTQYAFYVRDAGQLYAQAQHDYGTGIHASVSYPALWLDMNWLAGVGSPSMAARGLLIDIEDANAAPADAAGLEMRYRQIGVEGAVVSRLAFRPQRAVGSNATIFAEWTPVWNTTGLPTAFKINLIDTASDYESLIADWQRNSVSLYQWRTDGRFISNYMSLLIGAAQGYLITSSATPLGGMEWTDPATFAVNNGFLTGSGVNNYIPKWTSGNTLGNSAASDDGAAFGIDDRLVQIVTLANSNGVDILGASYSSGSNTLVYFNPGAVQGTYAGDLFQIDTQVDAASTVWNLMSLYNAQALRFRVTRDGAATVASANNITTLTLTGGSITAANTQSFFSGTGTWAGTGVRTAFKFNLDDGAQAFGDDSKMFDWQVDSSTLLSLTVPKDTAAPANGILFLRPSWGNGTYADSTYICLKVFPNFTPSAASSTTLKLLDFDLASVLSTSAALNECYGANVAGSTGFDCTRLSMHNSSFSWNNAATTVGTFVHYDCYHGDDQACTAAFTNFVGFRFQAGWFQADITASSATNAYGILIENPLSVADNAAWTTNWHAAAFQGNVNIVGSDTGLFFTEATSTLLDYTGSAIFGAIFGAPGGGTWNQGLTYVAGSGDPDFDVAKHTFICNDHNQSPHETLIIAYNTTNGSAVYPGEDDAISLGTSALAFSKTYTKEVISPNGNLGLYAAGGGTDTILFGVSTNDTDVITQWAGTTNSGILTWMEDEDYFKFSDDIALAASEYLIFDKASGNGVKVDTTTPTYPWHDLLGQIVVKGASALTSPEFVVYRGGVYQYRFSNDAASGREAFINFHIPHDYVPGTDMYIHVHWSQIVVDTGGTAGVPGVAKWYFDISYADGYGTPGGAADPFIAPITQSVTQQGSTTQYGHMIAEVAFTNAGGDATHLDRATIQVDGNILVRIYRDSDDVADTLDQHPFVHFVDIHYQSTCIGTKDKNSPFYT